MKQYNEILDNVKEEIEQVKNNLTKDLNLPEQLLQKFEELLNAPSKHIRPLVSFLYLKSLGYEIDEKQIEYQTAIELVHNASLIHDDVIDDCENRRDVKTINSEFDNHLAVISGDYLLSLALRKVIQNPKLIYMFCDTLETMTKGEFNQYFSRYRIPTIEEYIEKSAQKTAKLFETAICGSIFIANDKVENIHKNFAKNFGIAFQIRDDLINCKTSKTDINEGIYTAPVIFSGGITITDDAIEKTKNLLNNYVNNAQNVLANMSENIYKTALIELLGFLKNV